MTKLGIINWIPIALTLVGCGGFEATNAITEGDVERCAANSSLPAGRDPDRMALSGSSLLYVLDGYSGVTRFLRKSYGCGWELDVNWQNGGSLQFDGFLQDIDADASGALSGKDGSMVYFPGQDSCSADMGGYAVFPSASGFVVPSTLGLRFYSHSNGRCDQSGAIAGFGNSLGADVDDQGVVSVESVGGFVPERLVAYSTNGSSEWSRPLSQQETTEPYLCQVDRVRANANEIAVLDLGCGRVVHFDRQGNWIATVLLDKIGIRPSRVRDMALPELGITELLLDDTELTARFSWRALLGNASDGVIGSTDL